MRKICVFVGFYPDVVGGAEYQSKIIADELKIDFELFYISIGTSDYDKIEVRDNIKVYHVAYNKSIARLNKLSLYLPISRKILSILKKESPNIVYQRILNPFSFYLSLFQKKLGFKYILHIADKYSLIFSGLNIKSLTKKIMFSKIKSSKIDFIVQNSEQKGLLIENQVDPKVIHHIYNMHPVIDHVLNPSIKYHESSKQIIWIGSSRKVKQLDVFLDLADNFKNNSSLSFVIIGRIEAGEYGNFLQNRINQMTNLKYLGEQSNTIVNQELSKSFLTINTSVSEGFSNVMVQSWLVGVPVFSLNSNPDNLITEYKIGSVFYNDIFKMSTGIEQFIDNELNYVEMSKNSYDVATRLFSVNTNIKELLKIINL
ncbi:glycosyltransferase [Sphingobacteriaceae bacterium WQ 2009]|uniref:Glycosyltransferase n=1 Tax=Rhinopithecimicrobium faecis TaxID=2820698 RepID=A0A8T4H7V6_9SPHI|nr:glycosyltransferase [Sphingobacteriaceae bacterium WQ 2009]